MKFNRIFLKAVTANVRKNEITLAFTVRLDKDTFAQAKDLTKYEPDQWMDLEIYPHQLSLSDATFTTSRTEDLENQVQNYKELLKENQ